MRVRRTSRLILLDGQDRVLLFEVEDATVFRPEEPGLTRYWLTPGGSLEAGEGHAEAARRELWEETGMEGVEPGPWVALCEPVLSWAGETIRAHDRFYLTRIDRADVSLANMSDAERGVYRSHRCKARLLYRPSPQTVSRRGVCPAVSCSNTSGAAVPSSHRAPVTATTLKNPRESTR